MELQARVFNFDNKFKRYLTIRAQERVLIEATDNKIKKIWFYRKGTHRTKEFTLPENAVIKDGTYSIPEKQFALITKYNLEISQKKRSVKNAAIKKHQSILENSLQRGAII